MATNEVRTDKISLEIVTPRGAALSVSVDEVTAPSVQGEFGVMPGHLPLLAALRTGIVSYRVGGETKQVVVGPGFAEAGPDKLLILTNECVDRGSIDPVVIHQDLKHVNDELAQIEAAAATSLDDESTEKRVLLIQRQNWLAAQLELYGETPPATMRPHEEFGPTPLPQDEEETDSPNRA